MSQQRMSTSTKGIQSPRGKVPFPYLSLNVSHVRNMEAVTTISNLAPVTTHPTREGRERESCADHLLKIRPIDTIVNGLCAQMAYSFKRKGLASTGKPAKFFQNG